MIHPLPVQFMKQTIRCMNKSATPRHRLRKNTRKKPQIIGMTILTFTVRKQLPKLKPKLCRQFQPLHKRGKPYPDKVNATGCKEIRGQETNYRLSKDYLLLLSVFCNLSLNQ